MNDIHDYNISKYSIDFNEKRIILNVIYDEKKKNIIFKNFFSHYFYNELPFSVLSEIIDEPIEEFFIDNKQLLEENKKFAWPTMYDSLNELKKLIREKNLHYYFIQSSYGLQGWVLAEELEIV